MNKLIFSRANHNGILSNDEVRSRAPSVFADTKAPRLTDRYEQVYTADLLPVLADNGYFPVQAAQKRVRKGSNEHAAHLMAFARQQDIANGVDNRGEIVLFNSHDGTSAVKLFAGSFRFICSNGTIAGAGLSASVYHNKRALNDFEQMLQRIIDGVPQMLEAHDKLRTITLDGEQRWELATRVAATRWQAYHEDDVLATGTYFNDNTVSEILRATRSEDDLQDAFTVMQRIQENVVRGQAMVKSVVKRDEQFVSKLRKARPLASISEHVRVNREISDIFAELV